MAEERIAERIDAKLLNVTMDELSSMTKEAYMNKFTVLKRKTLGKIFVKEFQPGVCNANHIRHLMKELKTKKNFTPDIVMVDYLNLASSYRVAMSVGSYAYIKSVTEELRGLAMQNNIVVISPTQTNRSGQNATDFELNEVSECVDPEGMLITKTGPKMLKDIEVGEQIMGSRGWVTVMIKHHPKVKKSYRITTKSGKTILCSTEHQFPTNKGRLCINDGLGVGHMVKSL